MTLQEFFRQFRKGHDKRRAILSFCDIVGVSEVTARQWIEGSRSVPASRVIAVQLATDGKVPASTLAPGIFGRVVELPGQESVYGKMYEHLLKENSELKEKLKKITAIIEEKKKEE